MKAIALGVIIAACAGCSEPPESPDSATSTGCAAGQETIFSCVVGGQVASVCASPRDGDAIQLSYSGPGGASSTPEAGRYLSVNGGVLQYLRFPAPDASPVVFVSETRCGQMCWQRFEGIILERPSAAPEVMACDDPATFAREGDAQFVEAANRAGIAVDDGMGPRGLDGFPDIPPAQP